MRARKPLGVIDQNKVRSKQTGGSSFQSVRKSVKIDNISNQLKAVELIDLAQRYEANDELNDALLSYEMALDNLPGNPNLMNKITEIKKQIENGFQSSTKNLKKNVAMEKEIKGIVSKSSSFNQKNPSYEVDFSSIDQENTLPLSLPHRHPSPSPSPTLSREQTESYHSTSEVDFGDMTGDSEEEREEMKEEMKEGKEEEEENIESTLRDAGEAGESDNDVDEGDEGICDGEKDGQFSDQEDCDDFLSHRSSYCSIASTQLPREEMIAMLQQRTLQALEYQLFDRLNHGNFEELLQLKMIGKKRAEYILDIRKEHEGEREGEGTEGYFKSIEDLQEIGMKPKDCETFLKKNVLLLAGLDSK